MFPAVYVVYTLLRGPIVDWYPYPLNPDEVAGYAGVAAYSVGILVAIVAVGLAIRWWACHQSLTRPAGA